MLAQILSLSYTTLGLLCVGLFAAFSIFQVLLDPLRRVPGPLLARSTRFWYFFEIYKGRFEISNVELHRKYGAVVRVAPGEYSIDDVEAAKVIYGLGVAFQRFARRPSWHSEVIWTDFIIKGPWYWAWMPPDPNKASLFADLNPHRHSTQRRKYAAAYSMSSLVGYEPYVDNCTSLLVQRLSELASTPSPILDLGHWLQCYAFDVIGEITFGNRFGFLDMGMDEAGVFKAIDQRGQYSTFVGIFPFLHALVYPLLPKTGGHAYVANYTLSQMASRKKALKDPMQAGRDGPPDFMSRFLAAHEAVPEKMTHIDLFTICQSNIGAGSDTTAITLSAVFYHLMKNPSSLARLREEINSAYNSGSLKDSEPISFKAAQELKYFQAVVKEALRLHSATGLPMQRLVPAGGADLAGIHFPAGSSVGINAWVAHRNTSVFGSDADKWRPERWLEIEEQGRGGEVEKYFFAFGQGSRTCIGKNISLLEIQKLVPTLIRKFDFQLDESLMKREWATENRWFVKPTDFKARVGMRSGLKR